MVAPAGDERQCCMEEQCEGNFIPQVQNGFTLREFLLPSQEKAYLETRRYPIQRAPCIMCKRLQIARLLVSARAAGTGMREDCLVQDYYNFVNIPVFHLTNEFRKLKCLPPFHYSEDAERVALAQTVENIKRWQNKNLQHV